MTDKPVPEKEDKPEVWTPTKEELEALGFTVRTDSFVFSTENRWLKFYKKDGWCISQQWEDSYDFVQIFPKSLEELRILTNMMNP